MTIRVSQVENAASPRNVSSLVNGGHVGGLDGVLCVRVVVQYAARDPEQLLIVALHQRADGFLIASLCQRYQFSPTQAFA